MSSPRELAAVARAFETRLSSLDASADPQWRDHFEGVYGALPATITAPGSRRGQLAVFEALCGPVPDVETLVTPVGQWSLLPRDELLSRLCTLALARRPGILRSCVRRTARLALAGMVGNAYEPLRELSFTGPNVPGQVAERPPLDWAIVGYQDLTSRRLWPGRSMRRLVRFALPRVAARHILPPETHNRLPDTLDTVARVEPWFAA